LPGRQRWILQDHDADLLAHAAVHAAEDSADGAPVTVMTQRADLTRLTAGDLLATSLVTASALLDLLTSDEVNRLAAACVDADCPALLTLSVAGRVELSPTDPLDDEIAAAFADHLRYGVDGRHLLGPDAADAAADAFALRGATVELRPSPWRLGPDHAALLTEWLHGWVPAATARRPDLDGDGYLRRRLDAVAAGTLYVTIHHSDLLALPSGATQSSKAAS
jgi:hypothetical protein